jgi:hypothetical protein
MSGEIAKRGLAASFYSSTFVNAPLRARPPC